MLLAYLIWEGFEKLIGKGILQWDHHLTHIWWCWLAALVVSAWDSGFVYSALASTCPLSWAHICPLFSVHWHNKACFMKPVLALTA